MVNSVKKVEDRNEARKQRRCEGQSTDTAEEKLHIVRDPVFQRLVWKLQGLGRWVMLLCVVAGILVYLGQGLFTESQTGKSATIRLEYDPFIHNGAPTRLRVHLKLATHQEDHVDLRLSHRYLDRFQVQQVTPYPVRVRAPLDGVSYTFLVVPRRDSVVTFDLQPLRPGLIRGQVEVLGESVHFDQFVFP